MKLFVQIPCLNEAQDIAEAIMSIPREIDGFDQVIVLVLDDGSSDSTSEIARQAGADIVIRNSVNHGLAYSFIRGLEECLMRGADVIVNYDADCQYDARDILAITAPILQERAELVVGTRPIAQTEHFSWSKKQFQKLGSWVVRRASGVRIDDAPSGFRAVTRQAATKLYVFNSYTYTLETLIQAGRSNISVISVPIRTNPPKRESRLVKSSANYIMRSAITIARISFLYYPLRLMFFLAMIVATPGLVAILRFLIHFIQGEGGGQVQSLVLGSSLVAIAIVLFVAGLLADLMAANRRLLQEIRSRQLSEQVEKAGCL